MKLILLGPPGSGKGTRAARLMAELSIPQISTGDMFRSAIARGTPLGRAAKGFIDAGELVPDPLVMEMVRERLGQEDAGSGFILDGFPRTVAQAEALEDIVSVDAVLNLEVPDEVILKRVEGRRVCSACGRAQHLSLLVVPERCPDCGGVLAVRDDDRPETVRHRLEVYRKQTQPLVDHYRRKGLLRTVSAMGSVEEGYQRVREALGLAQP